MKGHAAGFSKLEQQKIWLKCIPARRKLQWTIQAFTISPILSCVPAPPTLPNIKHMIEQPRYHWMTSIGHQLIMAVGLEAYALMSSYGLSVQLQNTDKGNKVPDWEASGGIVEHDSEATHELSPVRVWVSKKLVHITQGSGFDDVLWKTSSKQLVISSNLCCEARINILNVRT